ncbi:MAG: hypothetical protein QM758_27525 [Armatimonas sp.]
MNDLEPGATDLGNDGHMRLIAGVTPDNSVTYLRSRRLALQRAVGATVVEERSRVAGKEGRLGTWSCPQT